MADELTRADALMILNDRCGQEVRVTVSLDGRAWPLVLGGLDGVLYHSAGDPRDPDALRAAVTREVDDLTGEVADSAGLYGVGDSILDVTDLHDARIFWPRGVTFHLSGDAWLTITWGEDE